MQAGRVEVLVIVGGNPVFTAPSDLNFADALTKVTVRVHMDLYHDETAELCQWHVPEAHFLESWGDVRSFDGTVSLIQPLVSPIYEGRTALELLAAMNGAPASTMDLVKEYWTRAYGGQTTPAWTLRQANGPPYANLGRVLASRAARRVHRQHQHAGDATAAAPAARRPRLRGDRIAGLPSASPRQHGAAGCVTGAAAPAPAAVARAVRLLLRFRRRPPSGRHGDRLPARSAHSRRPLRQQRLAAGTAEAALESHLGQRRVHQPEDGRVLRHSDRPRRQHRRTRSSRSTIRAAG